MSREQVLELVERYCRNPRNMELEVRVGLLLGTKFQAGYGSDALHKELFNALIQALQERAADPSSGFRVPDNCTEKSLVVYYGDNLRTTQYHQGRTSGSSRPSESCRKGAGQHVNLSTNNPFQLRVALTEEEPVPNPDIIPDPTLYVVRSRWSCVFTWTAPQGSQFSFSFDLTQAKSSESKENMKNASTCYLAEVEVLQPLPSNAHELVEELTDTLLKLGTLLLPNARKDKLPMPTPRAFLSQ